MRLVYTLKLYWFNRGLFSGLAQRLMVEALARVGAQERTLARCRGLFDAGQGCCFMGRYKEAHGYLEESLAIARELGDQRRVAAVFELLGIASLAQGDVAAARGHLEEALALARELGNKRELAAALIALAQLHRVEGDLHAAEPLYEKALALVRELGDREIIALDLLNLAMVSIIRGLGDHARPRLLEALAITEQIGSKPAGKSVLEVSAGLASLSEEWERAAVFFGVVETQMEQTGLHRDPADERFLAPLIAKAREALGEQAFAAAETAGRALSYEEAMTVAREWLEGRG